MSSIVLPMLSSESFIVSGLTFRFFNPFGVYLCAWCQEVFQFHSFTRNCPVFLAPFIEEAVFGPLYILGSFVKNKVPIGAWVDFWAFYLVPLVYISVLVPIPYCLDDCGFVYNLKSGRLVPPAPFFLRTALVIQGLFCFHVNCEICSISAKKMPLVI